MSTKETAYSTCAILQFKLVHWCTHLVCLIQMSLQSLNRTRNITILICIIFWSRRLLISDIRWKGGDCFVGKCMAISLTSQSQSFRSHNHHFRLPPKVFNWSWLFRYTFSLLSFLLTLEPKITKVNLKTRTTPSRVKILLLTVVQIF